MKSNRIFGLGALGVVALAGLPALAQDASPTVQPPANPEYYAAGAEGATLPSRVVRVRFPWQVASATSGFDKDGKKKELGLDLSVVGAAFVAEYGLTDNLSLQFLAPYVVSNKLGLDAKKFRQSKDYKDNYNRLVGLIATEVAKAGTICGTSQADCVAAINNGLVLPTPLSLPLPTGEVVVVENHAVRDVVDSLIVNTIAPQNGKTGLTDIEVGALWNPISPREPLADLPLYFSAGVGLRFPTGSFSDVPSAYRATGRGTTDLGLRVNLDWKAMDGLWVNYQNQSEFMLASGTKKKTSMLDNTKLNTANPTTPTARLVGSDGKGNKQKFERRGTRNVGFAKVAFGLGVIDQTLRAIGTNVQAKYDLGSTDYLDGKKQGEPSESYQVQAGITFDGFAYLLPVQVDLDYNLPVAGKNQALAPAVLSGAFKLFYKF